MSLRKARCRFTSLLPRLIDKAIELGYEIAIGKTHKIAPHMNNSLHYEGLAVDFDLYKDGEYLSKSEDHRVLGEYWESLDPNCSSGIRFNDGNHYSFRIDNRR